MMILITGEPKTGKSTAVKKIADMIGRKRCSGLLAEEIRENGERVGFSTVSVDGSRRIVLAKAGLDTGHSVDRYGVNANDFAGIMREETEKALADATRPFFIMDEIGRMQLKARKFPELVRQVADSGKTVIASICYEDEEPFVRECKARPDARVFLLTAENRDRIPLEIVEDLMKDDPVFMRKIWKAKNYRADRTRYTQDGDDVILRSTHDVRRISKKSGMYSCTCDYYRETGTCSHIISLLLPPD